MSSLANEDRAPSWGEKDMKEEINLKNQHSMTSPFYSDRETTPPPVNG